MKSLLAAAAVMLVLAGCAINGDQNTDDRAKNGYLPSGPGSFLVPQSGIDYAASYTVYDNGQETIKRVWRSGRRMRVDFEGSGGGGLSLFFLENRAYSCSMPPAEARCFEFSSRVGASEAGQYFTAPDLSVATEAEMVNIGGTQGRCYLFPSAPFQARKMCFTDKSVLAYDEQNSTAGKRHVEYLTDIAYAVSDSDFSLPAKPSPLPDAPG